MYLVHGDESPHRGQRDLGEGQRDEEDRETHQQSRRRETPVPASRRQCRQGALTLCWLFVRHACSSTTIPARLFCLAGYVGRVGGPPVGRRVAQGAVACRRPFPTSASSRSWCARGWASTIASRPAGPPS